MQEYTCGYQQNMTEYAVDSKHVVHLALSDGMNVNLAPLVIVYLKVCLKFTNKKNY